MQSQRYIAARMSEETGHTLPAVGAVIGAAGVIALGIGAANDTGWLMVAGGIVGGLGVLAASLLDHIKVDYDIFARLESLEGKKK